MTSLVISDPDNADNALSVGDVITVTFDIDVTASVNMALNCTDDISSLNLSGSWTANDEWTAVVQATGASLTIGTTICRPVIGNGATALYGTSEEATGDAILLGSFGVFNIDLIATLDTSVTCLEDSTSCRLNSSVAVVGSEPHQVRVELVAGDGGKAAFEGMAFADMVSYVGDLDDVIELLGYGLRVKPLKDSLQSFTVTFTIAALDVDGLVVSSDSAFSEVSVQNVPDLFTVTKGEVIPTGASGAAIFANIVVSDPDIDNSITAFLSVLGRLDFNSSHCPGITIRTSNNNMLLAMDMQLDTVNCLLKNAVVIPSNEEISTGMLDADLALMDRDADEDYRYTTRLAVPVSCEDVEDAQLIRAKVLSDHTIRLTMSKPFSFIPGPASTILTPQSAALVGVNSPVYHEGSSLIILPDATATFVVGDELVLTGTKMTVCPTKTVPSVVGTAVIEPPSELIEPVVSINGPEVVAFCGEGLELVASVRNLGGRKPVYQWSITGDIIESAEIDDARFFIAAELLRPGMDYNATLSITSYLGSTVEVMHTFTVSEQPIPVVTVLGVPHGAFPAYQIHRLNAMVSVSRCLEGGNRIVQYAWASECPSLIVGNTDGPRVTLDTQHADFGVSCELTLTVSMVTNPALSSKVTIDVIRERVDPIANVIGGLRRTFSQADEFVVSAALTSPDSLNLVKAWSCINAATDKACEDMTGTPLVFAQTDEVTIPALTFLPGEYVMTFSVTDTDSGVISEASQIISPTIGSAPSASIIEPETTIKTLNKNFVADVTSPFALTDMIFAWSIEGVDDITTVADSGSDSSIQINTQNLPSTSWTFVLNLDVTDPNGQTAESSFMFEINSPPFAGSVVCSHDEAVAMTTEVTFTVGRPGILCSAQLMFRHICTLFCLVSQIHNQPLIQ